MRLPRPLCGWITFLRRALPARSVGTFLELLIGTMLTPAGFVTEAYLGYLQITGERRFCRSLTGQAHDHTGRRHLNRLSPGHTLTSLIQDLGVVRFRGLKRDIRSIGLQKAAEWQFAMVIGHTGAWPITIGPDDGPGLRYQRRKTASACAGWAAKWRIMLAMDCRG